MPVGVPTVVADFAAKESLPPAFAGVESIYIVCSPIPALVELESNVIDACVPNDVKHVVLNSALGPAITRGHSRVGIAWWKTS